MIIACLISKKNMIFFIHLKLKIVDPMLVQCWPPSATLATITSQCHLQMNENVKQNAVIRELNDIFQGLYGAVFGSKLSGSHSTQTLVLI